jgi:hypothetical protein
MADQKISADPSLAAGSIAVGDLIPVIDISEVDSLKNKSVTFSALNTYLQGTLLHNSFSDHVANEHIDWTGAAVSLYTSSGVRADGGIRSYKSGGGAAAGYFIVRDTTDGTDIAFVYDGDNFAIRSEDHISTGNLYCTFTEFNGRVEFANEIIATDGIIHNVDNGWITLAGGTSRTGGANLDLYGGSHSSNAYDVIFQSDSTIELQFDYSTDSWDFQANLITTTGDLAAGHPTFTVTGGQDLGLRMGDVAFFPFKDTGNLFGHPTFQTRVTDNSTVLRIIPNGTSIISGLEMFAMDYYDDSSNWENVKITTGTTVVFETAAIGTGTVRPLEIRTGANTDQILLNIDGTVKMSSDIKLGSATAASTASIIRNVDSGKFIVSGGNADNVGANIHLYGGSHSTQAGDLEIYDDTTLELLFDASLGRWDFKAGNIWTTGGLRTLRFDASARTNVGHWDFITHPITWSLTTEDQPFFDFVATPGADTTSAVSTYTTGQTIQGHIQVEINGTKRWIPFYDDPTA